LQAINGAQEALALARHLAFILHATLRGRTEFIPPQVKGGAAWTGRSHRTYTAKPRSIIAIDGP
jgi:hypothetical protein